MDKSIVRPVWPGFDLIKHIVIFGDSYSDVGYNRKAPHPTADNPLGVDFPGFTLCCRYDEAAGTYIHEPNWVGHLIDLVKAQTDASCPLIYDFAVGGDKVPGIARQIQREFLPELASKPDWAPWTFTDTLFLTWIGINDCVWNVRTKSSVNDSVIELFSLQQQLYDAGARNFCLVDVPPIYGYPGRRASPKLKSAVLDWNKALREVGSRFSTEHQDATVLLWSSWDFFSRILTNPTTHGFREDDAHETGDGIFADGLHPTTRVHRLIAEELLALFRSVRSSAEDFSVGR